MKAKIDIDTSTFVRFWLVLLGFTFAILAIYSARTALMLILIAFFLALALNIPVNYLASRLPGKSRAVGTTISFFTVILVLTTFFLLVIPPIIEQTAKFIETIPALTETATTQWKGLNGLITKYNLQPQIDTAVASVQSSAGGWAANAGRNVIQGAGSILTFTASTVIVIVLAFLMLIEGPAWMKRLWGLYQDPTRMERHKRLSHKMYNVVTGYVTGQLTVAAIGAVLAGLVVFILSLFFAVPANLAMTTIAATFTLTLIPMFGSAIAGLLIAILLGFNDVTAGIAYALYFIVYQQVENNFISPTIQSRNLELSALAVLVAVTIGFYVFGILGGLVSIPIAGIVKVLLDEYLARAKDERDEKRRPLARLAKKIQGEA